MHTEHLTIDKLPCTLWLPDGSPGAMLQIIHGMTEHTGRYEAFAAFLTAHGIAVAGFDLRGHGKNGSDPAVASFGEGGWEESLEDIHRFRTALQNRYPAVPHFLLGFSLGSFLLREYLAKHSQGLRGAIIMGTGHQPAPVLSVLMAIVKGQCKKAGFDSTTPLVKKLSFETYNKHFAPNRTQADWLCGDTAALDAYLNDPLCRESISAGLFWQLLSAMKRTGKAAVYKAWASDLPILLLSGEEDPVGDFGKGVKAVHKAIISAGITDLQMKLYPQARHDLLHEAQCGAASEAFGDILQWLKEHL